MIILVVIAIMIGMGFWSYTESECYKELMKDN